MMHYPPQQAGFSLVETLVAISVLMLALVGPIVIAAKGLQTSYYAREQVTALFLAQEGVEAITERRNSHYIEYIRSLPTPIGTSWDWTTDSSLQACFSDDGCNFSYESGSGLSNISECGELSDCLLNTVTSGSGPLFTTDLSEGVASQFTRVVQLEEITDSATGDVIGVEVTSTVRWDTPLFNDGGDVVLTSVLYDYLQDF